MLGNHATLEYERRARSGAKQWWHVRLLFACCLALLFQGASLAADVNASSSHQDIFYLGTDPLLIRVHFVVDGKPWSKTRRALAKRQFDLLDTDRDGRLKVEQLAGLPLQDFSAEQKESWDTDVQDGLVSATEFREVFARFGQPSFLLAEGDSRAASRVRLFAHLDANDDGKLTERELARARMHLSHLDYDDDETISTTELTPFVNPLFQQRIGGREQPLNREAPFVARQRFEAATDLAAALLQRYTPANESTGGKATSKESANESDLRPCPIEVFGTRAETAPFDANKDDTLDQQELAQFLEELSPHIELQVELPMRRASRPKVKLLADRKRASTRRPSRIRGSSRLPLKLSNTDLDVRVLSSMTKTSDNRNFYLLAFRRADQDKNGYVDSTEFGRIGLQATFASVDLDGDEKLIREEMIAFLERDAFQSQSQVVLSVASDSRTLFTVIDQNMDQRITEREFQELERQVMRLDKNQDGAVELSEMADAYRLMFSMGRPRVFQQAMAMQNDTDAPAPRATPATTAPSWFRKMDRNQDGDLSWREFLGKRNQFDAMDEDEDGLISVQEAFTRQTSRKNN